MKISEIIDFNLAQKIICEIEDEIKANFNEIQNSIESDNKFFSESFSFKNITKSINLVKEENWNFKSDNSELIYTSIGNIGVVYDGFPDIAIYLILKAIKTNNNLVLFENTSTHIATKNILNIVRNVLKKNNSGLIINCKIYDRLEDIASYKEFFNKYICIGSRENYDLLRVKATMPITYNAYGTIVMYLDDKSDKQTLIDIDRYIYNNNIKLDLYKGDVEDSILKMNKLGHNFMLLIFSNDKNRIKKLVEKVNVNNICINKNPFLNDYNLFIGDEVFLESKHVKF